VGGRVTFWRSREARMEEAEAAEPDIYDRHQGGAGRRGAPAFQDLQIRLVVVRDGAEAFADTVPLSGMRRRPAVKDHRGRRPRHPLPDLARAARVGRHHPDPDYSATYVVVRTDRSDGPEGHGFTFTIGRDKDLVCAAVDGSASTAPSPRGQRWPPQPGSPLGALRAYGMPRFSVAAVEAHAEPTAS
jgi:hypothetical protein